MAESMRAHDRFEGNGVRLPRNIADRNGARETPKCLADERSAGGRLALQPANVDERSAQRQRWLDQARAGSNEARGQLLNSFLPMLWSYFNGQLSSELKTKVDPLDLAQSAFVRALPAFENFRGGDVAQMRDWLMTISIRLLIDLVEQYAPGSSHDISREQPLVDDADAGRHA